MSLLLLVTLALAAVTDADTDGVPADTDCDDANPAVGAPIAWYLDLDADGFGASDPLAACDGPAGMSAMDGDCDDTDPLVNPDATEACDQIDNDCDGEVDEDGCDTGLAGDPDVESDDTGAPSETGLVRDRNGRGISRSAGCATASAPGVAVLAALGLLRLRRRA